MRPIRKNRKFQADAHCGPNDQGLKFQDFFSFGAQGLTAYSQMPEATSDRQQIISAAPARRAELWIADLSQISTSPTV